MSDPKHCKGCDHISHGTPNTKYAVWCCAQGRPLPEAVGHCKLKGLHSFIRGRNDDDVSIDELIGGNS